MPLCTKSEPRANLTLITHANKLRNSSGKRYQRIQICLTGEVETPSFSIRRQAPDVKYPEKVARRSDRIPDVIYSEKVAPARRNSYPGGMSYDSPRRKGGGLRGQGRGNRPPDDTERASLSVATPSGFLKRTRGVLPYPDSLREKHTARTPSGFSLHSGFAFGKGL
uniref:Uncharacterized protein n=1 Tax=Vitis vinifera TaxID=29760 RepID=A5BVZ1_VITVI|nr:hypothetical protein VITISV_021478 [Vitis vinifera]